MDNQLVLQGVICKALKRKSSPAGIPHCFFELEHRSTQEEAGFNRQTWLRLGVVVSGEASQQLTHDLSIGSSVQVTGFLTSHKTQSGLGRLVLHAKHIEKILGV